MFHPLRALRRALYRGPGNDRRLVRARLPWGLSLDVQPSDAIGYSILSGGVFDPAVSETMYRLIDQGDLVVDVGANVGYLTSLAAVRAGSRGRVMAYEPHPRVFELLEANASRWPQEAEVAAVETLRVALSDERGTGELVSGPRFDENMGLASLSPHEAFRSSAEAERVEVPLERLDDVLAGERIGLLKIDVEGHEPAVLRGARELLAAGLVRDLIFEDHEDYPDESTRLAEEAGYRLFTLDNGLLGLRLGAPSDRGETEGWPGPSYLATRDPDRALARLTARGWRIRGIGPGLPRRISA